MKDDLEKARSDESVSDADRLIRLAHVVEVFRDVPNNAYIAAYATPDGGANGVTYGDIAALVRINIETSERLDRIATWHARETGPGGMVGDYCTECGETWPCDTRRMADGTYEEPDDGECDDPECFAHDRPATPAVILAAGYPSDSGLPVDGEERK